MQITDRAVSLQAILHTHAVDHVRCHSGGGFEVDRSSLRTFRTRSPSRFHGTPCQTQRDMLLVGLECSVRDVTLVT